MGEEKLDVKIVISKLWGNEEIGLEGMMRYIAKISENTVDDVAVEVIDRIKTVFLPDL